MQAVTTVHEHVSEFAAQIVVPMTWRGGGESTVSYNYYYISPTHES